MKNSITEGSELDGYEELKPKDQAKVVKAWQEGHVDQADIPETDRKPAAVDEDDAKEKEKPKIIRRTLPQKKAAAGSDVDAEERPKRKAKAAPAKVRSFFFKWLLSFF